jgi:hypothetical protein
VLAAEGDRSWSRLPGEHLGKHLKRAALHPALHERVLRDDQRRCPLSPGEAVAAEPLKVDQVDPAVADSVSHQWSIHAWCRAPERKATPLGMVKESFRNHHIRAISGRHRPLPPNSGPPEHPDVGHVPPCLRCHHPFLARLAKGQTRLSASPVVALGNWLGSGKWFGVYKCLQIGMG